MYIPKSFSEDDAAVLYAFMQHNNFAVVVSQHEETLVATHLPLMIDTERGVLEGHLARANSQWKQFDPAQELLIIFQGPHTYITPSWYENHPSVPTWNYAVVHAYGTPRIVDSDMELRAMLERLVNRHEANFPTPWAMDLPEDFMRGHLQAVVGIEIAITRLEGKFKLSQNRTDLERAHVIEQLATSDYPPDQAVAALMREREIEAK